MSINSGKPLPDRILNKPELLPGLQFYLGAFFDLDSERCLGEQLQKIPWSKILNYAHHYELEGEETEEFLYIIQKLDNHLLHKLNNQHKAKMAASRTKTR